MHFAPSVRFVLPSRCWGSGGLFKYPVLQYFSYERIASTNHKVTFRYTISIFKYPEAVRRKKENKTMFWMSLEVEGLQ